MFRFIQKCLWLYRPIKVVIPQPLDASRAHLEIALSTEICLSGKFQLTRYYQGELIGNHLKLYGPRANRQFCFLTEGELYSEHAETIFTGKMSLRTLDAIQWSAALVITFVFLAVPLRWGVISIWPIFAGFMYGMLQWHFQGYAQEITQLLRTLMTGEPLMLSRETSLFPWSW